jgi:hypothetical protein
LTEIVYRFHFAHGAEDIRLEFDAETFLLKSIPETEAPAWAALDFHKCGHCPLSTAEHPACPFASALSGYVDTFGHLVSHEELEIEVITPTRRIIARRPLQSGIASMIGLIGATSGCPTLSFYRPIARFHLPFAEEEETVFRVVALFLMRALMDHNSSDFSHLNEIMAEVGKVNEGMAERIRGGFTKDAMINAIVILDCFALTVPMAIESRFDGLGHIFK